MRQQQNKRKVDILRERLEFLRLVFQTIRTFGLAALVIPSLIGDGPGTVLDTLGTKTTRLYFG